MLLCFGFVFIIDEYELLTAALFLTGGGTYVVESRVFSTLDQDPERKHKRCKRNAAGRPTGDGTDKVLRQACCRHAKVENRSPDVRASTSEPATRALLDC